MFINFFFNLKARGIPVSLHEWITLHEAISMNLNDCSLTQLYHMARSILVKNEIFFDRYDMAFLDTLKDIETTDEMLEKILEGLKKVRELHLSEEEKKQIEQLKEELYRLYALLEEKKRDSLPAE